MRVIAVCLLVISSGLSVAAQTPKAQAPAAASASGAPPDNYTYDAGGRRDPFVSLLGTGTGPRLASTRAEGAAGLTVGEISVRGIMQSRSGLIAMIQGPDNKTYLVLADTKAFREGAGQLLAEVQRIKSEGDFAAAKALFEAHGIHFDAALRDEIVNRVDSLNLPSYSGFVMPKLTAVKGPDGTITDVQISYPMDLTKQMLEYAQGAD